MRLCRSEDEMEVKSTSATDPSPPPLSSTTSPMSLLPRQPLVDASEHSFFPVIPGDFDETKPRFVPLSTQVAGHDGVLSDENGFVIIKPCTDNEISFYEQCLASESALMDCIPAFMGTLELNTPETLASMAPEVTAALPSDMTDFLVDPAYSPPSAVYERAVVLENLAFGYSKPCILDLKLGFQLWDEDASPEKRARLDAVRDATTSGSLGVRIAGMKVWLAAENAYKAYERSWGKSLTSQTIGTQGLAGFFATRIRKEQKHLIVRRFLDDMEQITRALDETDVRIFSPSLLFVYEGDQAALDLAIEDEGKQMIWDELGDGSRTAAASYAMPNDDPTGEQELDSDVASSQDEELARDFCTCRLIDFAHARFTPGQGRDENISKAVKAAKRLFVEYLSSTLVS